MTSLRGWGIAPLPRADDWCRRELDDSAAALCRLLHGVGQPGVCTACRALVRGAQ